MTIAPGAAALLAAQFSASLQKAVQNAKTSTVAQKDQEVRDGNVIGFATLDNVGEMTVTVHFPITMYEKPIFTCGLEFGDNAWPQDGRFPVWSATVVKWETRDLNGTIGYEGAEIALVIFAFEGMTSFLHYSFQARSFTNPTSTGDAE